MPFVRPSLTRSRPPLLLAREDPKAFTLFYDRYVDRLLVFFTRRVLDAEAGFDLMSETFAKAFERRAQFRGTREEHEAGWLFAIARNELADYWRRGGAEHQALERIGVPVPALTDAEIERIEELADVEHVALLLREAMQALPAEHAEAVRLRVVEGHGYAQIAEDLCVSQQLVRARVSRGLRALARQLRNHVDEGVL